MCSIMPTVTVDLYACAIVSKTVNKFLTVSCGKQKSRLGRLVDSLPPESLKREILIKVLGSIGLVSMGS